MPALRARLAAIRPAAHGISPRTFSNLRSLFAAAMEWAGVIERFPRGAAKMDPAWAPLAAAIAGDKRLANGLAAFMNWCAQEGVSPAASTTASCSASSTGWRPRTLHSRPRDLVRQIPALWTDAQALVPGWPATELAAHQLPAGLAQFALGGLAARAAD